MSSGVTDSDATVKDNSKETNKSPHMVALHNLHVVYPPPPPSVVLKNAYAQILESTIEKETKGEATTSCDYQGQTKKNYKGQTILLFFLIQRA